ncbi:MAG: hypothetical protein JWR07_4706 [Nevskia sp.]|nr:hypothetical protein [Nevskia sp.]
MATEADEHDTSPSVRKKRHKWAKFFVVVVLIVVKLVRLAREIDKFFPALREWLTNR